LCKAHKIFKILSLSSLVGKLTFAITISYLGK